MNPIINNIDNQFSSKTSEIFDSLQKNLKILPNSNKEDNENNFSITKLKNLYDECVQAGKLNISEDSQKLIFDNINKVLKNDKLDKENFKEFFSGEGIKNIFFSQQSPDENKDNDSIFLSAFKLVGGGEKELKYGNLKEKIAKFFHMINNPNDSNSKPTLEEEEKAETQTNEIFKYLGLEDEDNIMSLDKFKSFLSGPSTINDIKDDLI
jgi:hypothetical protein